jgi:succinate-semialdehyde dehydrogenase/glutarate-semialdehyde dehydrogenase
MTESFIKDLISHLGATSTTVGVINPNTGKVFYELPQQNAEQVASAVNAARHAQKAWGKTDPKQRAKFLYKLHDLLLEDHEELLDIVQIGRAHV